jgi:hypothetical protein
MNRRQFTLAVLVTLSTTLPSLAATVAHWRWEEGPAGTNVPHTIGAGQFEATIPDVSGNGNHLSVWENGGGAGYQYRSDVPYWIQPGNGNTNNFSVKNTGGGPAMFTDSAVSLPTGVNIETMTPGAFTVEASWKPEAGGHRTVVGRDGQNVATAGGAISSLYLQARPDNSVGILFVDMAGNVHEAFSPADTIQGYTFGSDPDGLLGNWYNLAGVSDGSTLKMYVNGALVASTPIVSADPRLVVGTGGGGDWHAGEWSVGRGLFGGGHTDRAYGYIDEVRISDSALAPSELLVPIGLSLEVNTVNGEVKIKNESGIVLNPDFYRISSAASTLNFAGWDSLDDQNYDADDGTDIGSIAGDSLGEGWDQGGGSNDSQLIEYFVREEGSDLTGSEILDLGNAFDPTVLGSGVDGDLVFTYGYIGGAQLTGKVNYVGSSVSVDGDYDGNGTVDAADYTVWRDSLGQNGPGLAADGDGNNSVNQDDFIYWRNRFGNTNGSGSAAVSAVPEPGTCALLVAMFVGIGFGRRPRN